MSALLGFTGPPDAALLSRMADRLTHRGAMVDSYAAPAGTVAVCEWPGHRFPGAHATGIHQEASGVTNALSGFLFGEWPQNPQGIEKLRGSFCIAQLHSESLIIARDAVGTQSLYYGQVIYPDAGPRWLVATEPKAIHQECLFQAKIREASVAQYLAFSFVPGQHTMLGGIFEAEAGWRVELDSNKEPVRTRYFRFEDSEEIETQQQESDSYWARRTRHAVEEAVAERLVDEEPMLFLSGGLDSSIVAAELARQSRKPIRTFAIHFGDRYANELPFAASVAERIGSRHEEVLIEPKHFLPRMQSMVWHLDEPIGDPITQPNFELASIVGQHGNLVFNGEGGDPLFGGPKNLTMLLSHWYGGIDRPANFREKAYLASYRRAYEEWDRLLSDGFRGRLAESWGEDGAGALEHVLTPFFECSEPKSFLNKLMAINIRLKGANLILPKVDRMLAAHRLVPLSPLFDDRLTRLSFEMPPRMKLRHGIEKYALKLAYQDLLPKEIIDRPKSGMRVPVHYWFQKELKRHARKLLSKRNLLNGGIFDPERVQQLLRYDTQEGPGRYGLRLWMLLTFETWRRFVFGQ